MIDKESWLTSKLDWWGVDWWGKSIDEESQMMRKVDWWGSSIAKKSQWMRKVDWWLLIWNSITNGHMDNANSRVAFATENSCMKLKSSSEGFNQMTFEWPTLEWLFSHLNKLYLISL